MPCEANKGLPTYILNSPYEKSSFFHTPFSMQLPPNDNYKGMEALVYSFQS